MESNYTYKATEVIDVHDGDTYFLGLDVGFYCSVSVWIRLRGVNCPEIKTPEGKAAQEWVDIWLRSAKDIQVVSFKGPRSHKDVRSFARWVADVYVDGVSLAQALLDAGHAVPMK